MSAPSLKAIGRFQLVEHLGRGGFADVYSAHDPSFDSLVAVKILLPDVAGDLEVRRRFRDEAVLLRRVQVERPCPYLVTVHEIGEWEARPYLVMTHCQGGTVAERLQSNPSAPLAERIELATSVCTGLFHALDALHRANVVHRDVKPSNLLVGGSARGAPHHGRLIEPGEMILLADLGLAKDLVASRSALSLGGGTVGYMAPEQHDPRRRPTPAADLYAATMVIAVVLMGTRPEGAWQRRVVDLGVDPSLIDVIETGTAANPLDRHQTAAQWHDDVQTSLSQSRTAARTRSHSETGGGREPAWSRRVAAGAGVLAALAGAVGIGTAIVVGAGRDGPDPGGGNDTTTSISGQPSEGVPTSDAPATSSQADPSSTAGAGTDSSIDAAALATVLIDAGDLGDGAITLDEKAADSGADPDHPLTTYDFCGTVPDLRAVGPGANRVLTTNVLASDAIVVSSASVAASPQAAEAVAADILAGAAACETYRDGLTEVTVVSALATSQGGEIQVQFVGSGGETVVFTVAVIVVGDIVTTLEVSSGSDRDRLEKLLFERAVALT